MNEKRLPNIVALGGGTGLSTFLQGLKKFPVNITAIVTVADNGGSSGVLREDLKIPPPGDIRNVIVSLSNSPDKMQELLQFRFCNDDESQYLSGHPVGNLILAAMTQIHGGDFMLAVKKTAEMLDVNGTVFPVSHKAAALCGRTETGRIIKGEANFVYNEEALVEVFYEEEVTTSPEVIQAISNADVIVLGPGSLYTSVLPNIIIPSVAKAIRSNKRADVVYISNIMTEAGETDGYSVENHIEAIHRHGVDNISKVIINDQPIPSKILRAYREECSEVVRYGATNEEKAYDVILSRIARIHNQTVRHDSIKTAAAVYSVAIEHI